MICGFDDFGGENPLDNRKEGSRDIFIIAQVLFDLTTSHLVDQSMLWGMLKKMCRENIQDFSPHWCSCLKTGLKKGGLASKFLIYMAPAQYISKREDQGQGPLKSESWGLDGLGRAKEPTRTWIHVKEQGEGPRECKLPEVRPIFARQLWLSILVKKRVRLWSVGTMCLSMYHTRKMSCSCNVSVGMGEADTCSPMSSKVAVKLVFKTLCKTLK